MEREARVAKVKQESVDEEENGYAARSALPNTDPRANPDDSSGEVPASDDDEDDNGSDE